MRHAMLRNSYRFVALACAFQWLGCGGEEPPPETAPEPQASVGFEAPKRGGMDVSGLMGTIPERKILAVLEPKLPKFQRCFFDGSSEVEWIGGEIELYFHVNLEGVVEWVYPRKSTIGHRATEQCILAEAKRAKFPGPKGGDAAEISWGFAFDSSAPRAPVEWGADEISAPLSEHSDAASSCGGGRFDVTAYVAPGGQVIGAGAAADSETSAEQIDCVVQNVTGWTMPNPGSYPAKVSFELH
jgi:hypothetical protein